MKFQVWYSISLVPISSNPRTPCGVRHRGRLREVAAVQISIHAPRAGCDKCITNTCPGTHIHFNPRTPCGVRRPAVITVIRLSTEFQSTHPVRGATHTLPDLVFWSFYFNPRTPCGVRRRAARLRRAPLVYFNPRTPCGVRRRLIQHGLPPDLFQSTHPVRGATCNLRVGKHRRAISIHAPRAGCDNGFIIYKNLHTNFNPRTPCGVRLFVLSPCSLSLLFQSTHPVRGATQQRLRLRALLRYFNPRTPCGVRPGKSNLDTSSTRFQSTHPVRGATCDLGIRICTVKAFQSTHPVRGATRFQAPPLWFPFVFQSTHPVRGATAIIFRGGRHNRISIHAPRAGCDYKPPVSLSAVTVISIHAPRAGCDRYNHPI